MILHTKCDGCVFAEIDKDSIQSGCQLGRDVKLGVQEINDNGFMNLKRFCNSYRPQDWLPMLSLDEAADLQNTVMEEIKPRVGFFVILNTNSSDAIGDLKSTLSDIKNQKNADARYVVVINDKVEYNSEIQSLFWELFNQNVTMHHIVQINTTFVDKCYLVDEAFIHAKNGWIYVTSSGENVEHDILEKIHQRVNIDMKILSIVKPYDDINGMIFQASLFKYLNGNKAKVYDDDNIDNRKFLEKVEDMSQASAKDSVIEWGDFYG